MRRSPWRTRPALAILLNSLGVQPDGQDEAAAMPSATVAYRLEVPAREPALTTPRVDPVEGDGLRVSRTFRRHPALADARAINPRYVLDPEQSRLTPHDRELLILRTGWNAQAVYEWAKHVGSVGRARDHGLDPAWIAQGQDAPGWNDRERLLIDAADEMYRDSMIADRDVGRAGAALRHAPDDEHHPHRGSLSDGVDGPECAGRAAVAR